MVAKSLRELDGSRTDTQAVNADTWSIDVLHGLAFGTDGASVAETLFDADRLPIRTVFVSDNQEEVSTIRYEYDAAGKIVDAIQHRSGDEQFRAKFQYDQGGLIVKQEILFAGQLTHRTFCTYNDNGDLIREITESEAPSYSNNFEYQYDSHGNWIRKLVHHSLGTDEIRRQISYYE